jgi:hypothetical protein
MTDDTEKLADRLKVRVQKLRNIDRHEDGRPGN